MVLATKRAAGSEYDYPSYYPNTHERQSPPARKQKVRARTKRQSSPVVGLAVISLLFALGLSYVFLQATKAHMNWQISKAEENMAVIQMDNEKLRLEVAELSSLDRIESIASSQLLMIKSPKVEYLAFQDGIAGGKSSDYLVNSEAVAAAVLEDVSKSDNILQKIAAAISEGIRDKGSDSRWSEEIVSTY